MRVVFADTFYFVALLSTKDAHHDKVVGFTKKFQNQLVTTTWVLVEVANQLRRGKDRGRFLELLAKLRANPNATILPTSDELFETGIDLYRRRHDKEWSLTDCISFAVMERDGITEALTGDHHFEQAGFKALLA